MAFDKPYAEGRLVQGPIAYRWSPEKIARQVDDYIQAVRSVFPGAIFGNIEPLWSHIDIQEYKTWMFIFREVNGYDLDFFHLDIDFARSDWPQAALELEAFARDKGIEFGIIYMGNEDDPSDEKWIASAGERVKTYELQVGSQPDHIIFQSWHDLPDYTLPETESHTFTGFIKRYFEERSSLGFRTQGSGANIAFGKNVRVSRY